MDLSKSKRIVDRALLYTYHSMPCLVCNSVGSTVGHHVKSKKSGGDDVKENLMPLCWEDHAKVHNIGLMSFSKNIKVYDWLIENGWYIDGVRWRK